MNRPLIRAAGWQIIPLRVTMPRRSRLTWRRRWPVMIAPTYTSSPRITGSPRRINGLYVRFGERAYGISVMPWHGWGA